MKKHTFLLTVIFILITSSLIEQPLLLENLNTPDSLSNSKAFSIFQNSYGPLWIGNEYGHNHYDGYNFKIFRSDLEDTQSMNCNLIWRFVEDKEKNLWIARDPLYQNTFKKI